MPSSIMPSSLTNGIAPIEAKEIVYQPSRT